MKYAIHLGDRGYIRALAWFSENIPVVTLTDSRIENAQLFDDREKESIFKGIYPETKYVPVSVEREVDLNE